MLVVDKEEEHPFTWHSLDPRSVERLLDKETVRSAYANNGLRGAASIIGVGPDVFRRALIHHKIPVRKKGQKPPGDISGMVNPGKSKLLKELRKYLEDKDAGCPPHCPAKGDCLISMDQPCVLAQIVREYETA